MGSNERDLTRTEAPRDVLSVVNFRLGAIQGYLEWKSTGRSVGAGGEGERRGQVEGYTGGR